MTLDSWLFIALLTTAAWALSCVIDACFVGDGIFESPTDGPAIMGLFCVIPLGVFGSGGWSEVGALTAVAAIAAGLFHLSHLYFYFNALFCMNDVANAEIFNSLSVLCVPVIAFVLLEERLAPAYYVAVVVAASGTLVLVRAPLTGARAKLLGLLTLSVVSVSLSMVLQAWVFRQTSYQNGVALFSAAAFFAASLFVLSRRTRRRRIARVCWRFGWVLFCVQLLELAGLLGSQRATDVGPSVTLVALVECALPIFIMLFSWILFRVVRRRPSSSGELLATLRRQTQAYPTKALATALISVGIWIGSV